MTVLLHTTRYQVQFNFLPLQLVNWSNSCWTFFFLVSFIVVECNVTKLSLHTTFHLRRLSLPSCRLDIGDGRDVDLQKCPRSLLRQQCINYLGPVSSYLLRLSSLTSQTNAIPIYWWKLFMNHIIHAKRFVPWYLSLKLVCHGNLGNNEIEIKIAN